MRIRSISISKQKECKTKKGLEKILNKKRFWLQISIMIIFSMIIKLVNQQTPDDNQIFLDAELIIRQSSKPEE
jgi:hypothetical protein